MIHALLMEEINGAPGFTLYCETTAEHMDETNTLHNHLIRSALFKDVDDEAMEEIAKAARYRTVKQGDYIYRQGEEHRRFYIIVNGEVELTMDVDGTDQLIVSHIGPGGHFGETSLLTGSSNCINARALTELTLICFDAETFDRVLMTHEAIERQLSIALANRLRLSFRDHVTALTRMQKKRRDTDHNLDSSFFSDSPPSSSTGRTIRTKDRQIRLPESTLSRQITKAVQQFGDNLEPVLITGEAGTGRRMVAHEIHRASICKSGPYTEIDIRNIDPELIEEEIFGYERDSFAFSQIDRLGVFERHQGGTVVLYNAEHLEPDFQRQLVTVIRRKAFTKVGGDAGLALRARIILICTDALHRQDGHSRLLPTLYALAAKQHFPVAPLRLHRRDIPRLVHFYLNRYSRQYGKTITQVDEGTMGMFMNYDWPGNLTEMVSIIQRAIILGKNNEPLNDQVLLGVPRSEGKWEYNLLRLRGLRTLLSSSLFPVLPRAIVGLFLVFVLAALIFGPDAAEQNIGLTLSWVVGWPLLIFAFFFLARTWCSICGLSVPGWLAQRLVKPQRLTPQFIKLYSGWIMAVLCILLFWIETTWDAYHSPLLTASIIASITLGSLFFSLFYKRRVWCRYLCPLGAINALFSMPSILELRSNTQMCMHRCTDHVCYSGNDEVAGCPMFRHPFLVDNNRDCILCGQCIKNCQLHSIHLNLRLAPQELWNQQVPRLEDSLLVVSLAAVIYPFTISQKYPDLMQNWMAQLHNLGLPYDHSLAASILFFGCIIAHLGLYAAVTRLMAKLTGNTWKTVAALLGYGMIPLVLGAFMAVHLEIFVGGIWILVDNIKDIAGIGGDYRPVRMIDRDATFILQFITITGALIASLYATKRIVLRLLVAGSYSRKIFMWPALLLLLSAMAYLRL